MSEHLRWLVEIDYRTSAGVATVIHPVVKLEEVNDLLEVRPDWHALEEIRIRLNPKRACEVLTIEEDEARKKEPTNV